VRGSFDRPTDRTQPPDDATGRAGAFFVRRVTGVTGGLRRPRPFAALLTLAAAPGAPARLNAAIAGVPSSRGIVTLRYKPASL
jgi:hypothetical protein